MKMKKILYIIVAFALCSGRAAFSEEAAAPNSPNMKHHKKNPCFPVIHACKEAGFMFKKQNNYEASKDVFKACVDPLVAGTAVPGVTVLTNNKAASGQGVSVSETVVKACGEKMAEHKELKERKEASEPEAN
jgi:hypothetical protein